MCHYYDFNNYRRGQEKLDMYNTTLQQIFQLCDHGALVNQRCAFNSTKFIITHSVFILLAVKL